MSKGIFTILSSVNTRDNMLFTGMSMLEARLNTIYQQNKNRFDVLKVQLNRLREARLIAEDSRMPQIDEEIRILERELKNIVDPRPTIDDVLETHNLYVVSRYKPHVSTVYEYIKVNKENAGVAQLYPSDSSNRISFNLKGNNGHFLNDQVIHLKIEAQGNANSNVKLFYCDYPGFRICKRIGFRVADVTIDDYDQYDAVFDYQLLLDSVKELALRRGVNQEDVQDGSWYSNDFNVNYVYQFTDGPQTPQPLQQELDLWIPCQFWYNKNIGTSFKNYLLLNSNKYIDVDLANLNDIIFAQDANGNRIQNYFSSVKITTAELYSRNIYINQGVADLFRERVFFDLIRVHKRQIMHVNKSEDNIVLNKLHFPVEHLSIGFRPIANTGPSTWYRMSSSTTKEVPVPAVIINPFIPVPITLQMVVRTATYKKQTRVADYLGLNHYGNIVYPMSPVEFYNILTPYSLLDSTAPKDIGVYSMPLCYYRNNKDSNGYINTSTDRELSLLYRSSSISMASPAVLYVMAQCMSILIYNTDGSIQQHYMI